MRRICGWLRPLLPTAAVLAVLAPAVSASSGPDVTLSPATLAFADQPIGTKSDAQSVTLTNSGDSPLTISNLHFGGTDPSDFAESVVCPIDPDTLAPGASCVIYIAFLPDSAGPKSA